MKVEHLVAASAGAGILGGLALAAGWPVGAVVLLHLIGGALALGLARLAMAPRDGSRAEAWLEPVPALVPRSAGRGRRAARP